MTHLLSLLIQHFKKQIEGAIPLPEEVELTDRLRAGIRLALPLSTDADKVLDLGCSYGYLEALISRKVKYVVGVDVDKKAINLAKKNVRNSSNIHLLVADIEKGLPFRPQSFNKVLFFDVLEHLKNDNMILKEINRILEDDGILIISVPP